MAMRELGKEAQTERNENRADNTSEDKLAKL